MKKHRLLKKADILLIGGLLLAIGALALWLYAGRAPGGTVRVEQNGATVDEFPLTENTVRSYDDGNGGVNVVTVENGAVSVSRANCPGQLCARHRAVSRAGESIVCLPHKLVVSVVGQAVDVDAVA